MLCAEFVSYSFGLSDGQVDEVTDDYWSGCCSDSRPVCHVGNGDRFVCHCLSDCRPPGERTYVFVFAFVCCCSCVCVCVCLCVCCTLASLGYPLQPVQETNKLHFNMRNINFPLDGKLIMAVEPPLTYPRYTVSLLGWRVSRQDNDWSMHQQIEIIEGEIWLISLMSVAFCGFVKWTKKRYLSVQSMSVFQLLLPVSSLNATYRKRWKSEKAISLYLKQPAWSLLWTDTGSKFF